MIIFDILKKAFIIAIIILCFFLIIGKDYKKEIFAIVQDNQSVLQGCVETNDYEKAKQLDGVEDVNYYQAGPWTEFYCYGEGIAGSGAEYGFYYSPDDTPLGIYYTEEEEL